MVDAMRDPKLVPSMQGDLALLVGGTMTSYRSGGTYSVGSLPFWLWPEWLLQDQPIAIIAIMVVAATALGIVFNRILVWRAGRRTARVRPRSG
jgi:cellulose synthase (UDP-forming)